MSIGTDLFSVIVHEEARSSLSDINPNWLTNDELEIYEFIRDHVRLHGNTPTYETLERNGYDLPDADDCEPISYYIEELPRRAIHQRMQSGLPELAEMLERRQIDPLVTNMRELLEFATFQNSTMNLASFQDEVEAILGEYRTGLSHGDMMGVPTGYPILDTKTNGYQGGDLVALVGRPSMGKSYLLFNKANAAWRAGKTVLIITPEMLIRQCSRRILALNTGVNPDAIRRGHISPYVRDDFFGTIEGFDGAPPLHFMAADFRTTVADIDILVQELMPDAVYVDSAYLIQPSTTKRRNSKREFISDTFEELKGIGMRRDIPVIVSTQFNREVKRNTRFLDLSMIAESDAIGQLVSVALGVGSGTGVGGHKRRTLSMMKNREGDVCEFDTHFLFAPVRFDEVPGSERPVYLATEEGSGSRRRPRRSNNGPTAAYVD